MRAKRRKERVTKEEAERKKKTTRKKRPAKGTRTGERTNFIATIPSEEVSQDEKAAWQVLAHAAGIISILIAHAPGLVGMLKSIYGLWT